MRISTYRVIRHVALRRVDYYTLPDREVHIVHGRGCGRVPGGDVLCSCQDPETWEVAR